MGKKYKILLVSMLFALTFVATYYIKNIEKNNDNDQVVNILHDFTSVNDMLEYSKNDNVVYALGIANERRQSINILNYNDLRQYNDIRQIIIHDAEQRISEIFGREHTILRLRWFLSPLNNVNASTQALSIEQVKYDINVLDLLLRAFYGMHMYFGGVEAFEGIFNAMIYDLLEQEEWCREKFINLIHRHLSKLIIDNHFLINNRHLGWNIPGAQQGGMYRFFVSDVQFGRNEDGFYFKESGINIIDVNGYNMDSLFRLNINEYGELFYSPIIYFMQTEYLPVKYVLYLTDYDNNKIEVTLSEFNAAYRFERNRDTRNLRNVVSAELINDIPVIRMMRMGYPTIEEEFNNLLHTAYTLRNHPVVIIDIRSNQGGNGILPAQFMYHLTGEIIPTNSMSLISDDYNTSFAIWGSNYNDGRITQEDLIRFSPAYSFGTYCFVMNYTPREVIENDRLFVFLIDRFTVSASELLVDIALNLENTLIVGQNTAGALVGSNGYRFYLPNSNTALNFGTVVTYFPEGIFKEGVGFAPDIWATGDALTAALALIGRR
ncbi:MAG: S41 family peptidase [Defluviitaleaceae bacterium]|nr:S41 family peptidase [Defluviitaleaceae bacterium]